MLFIANSDGPLYNTESLKTGAGVDVTSFAKFTTFGKDLYADLVAPGLQVSLLGKSQRPSILIPRGRLLRGPRGTEAACPPASRRLSSRHIVFNGPRGTEAPGPHEKSSYSLVLAIFSASASRNPGLWSRFQVGGAFTILPF